MSTNDGTSGTLIPGDLARAGAQAYDRRIAELEEVRRLKLAAADAAGDAVVSHKACERLEAEVEQLRTYEADWRGSVSRIMAESCASNEVHCTCVPVLRKEVERLNKEILNWSELCTCEATDHKRELAEYRAIITKLGRRLGRVRKRRKRELAEGARHQQNVEWLKDVMRKADELLSRERYNAAYNCISLAVHNLAVRENADDKPDSP